MKKRTILFYWLFLLVPTCVIGVSAFYLILHEQERINQEALSSARDRARTIAEAIMLTVEAFEGEFTHALSVIPEDRLTKTLLTWEDSNPLVRNVFIWDRVQGLQYPPSGAAATAEEKRFAVRYHALFSGRIPWREGNRDGEGLSQAPAQGREFFLKKGAILGQDFRTLASQGRALEAPVRGGEGWIPWFEENRLHILGWVQKTQDGPVYGIELELMALLSRVIADFPKGALEGIVYAIMDGEGRVLHQTGEAIIVKGVRPDQSISLAPSLPHWQISLYTKDGSTLNKPGRGFVIVACLLLVIFVASIVLGGSLLTRQMHQNMKESRQKTSFVSNVSHELKTPLTSIRMYAELLKEGRVKDPEKKEHYLQVIVAESQRLARLVNNILDFSRLEQGRKTYRTEDLDLGGFVREMMAAHELRINEAGMHLRVSVPHDAVFVEFDRDALEQVLLNLIDNAIKYAPEGGELAVTLNARGSPLELSVMDRGPGVPHAHLEKVFEKFHRVDDSLTSRHPGSGLGLSIAKRIMLDLGGDIRCEPREGGGSRFVVIFKRGAKMPPGRL